ncbi:MAG: glycosyltransferase family 2 protein, partial [Prevotella sp.]
AAISGSGIAYEYRWFKENIKKVTTGWEDKEMEALLMRQQIYVDYFDNIYVYDEKTRHIGDFNKQRSRWASTQLRSILSNIRYLPAALFYKRYDMVDKIIQWMLMPRMLMMGIIVIMSIVMPFIYMSLAVKWWITFAVVMLVFAIATPDYLVNKKWDHAFFKAPFIMLASLFNLTKIIKTNKKFENRN